MEPILDRDTHEVIALLREAVTRSGLSQAAFARALGTSAPRLSTYLTGDSGLMSAPVVARAMRDSLQSGETAWVWRMLLQGRDHLVEILATGDQVLVDSWEAEPGDVGSEGWSALLGALTGRTFDSAGVQVPGWRTRRRSRSRGFPSTHFFPPDRVRALTPAWLRRLNLYVPARDLVSL